MSEQYGNEMNRQEMPERPVEEYHIGTYTGSKTSKKNSRKKGFLRKTAVAMALGLAFGGCAGGALYGVQALTGSSLVSTQASTLPSAGSQGGGDTVLTAAKKDGSDRVYTTAAARPGAVVTTISEVAEDVLPSVVAITNDMVVTGMDWFGQTYEQEGAASGSGVIVGKNDDELLIVTNQHVIDDSTKLSVQFADGATAEANLKGQDEDADIAVIAVDFNSLSENTADQIRVATMGDSDALVVGEPAIAIGNALGYGQSVTAGIISALNREVTLNNGTHTLIQTDAAINPGNSGGALLNLKGELIGINEAKAGGAEIEGMGYAIPISSAKPIIENLMNKTTKKLVEESKQAMIGIAGVDVTKDAAKAYDMPEGVYIAEVQEGSGAEKAGLTKGDILTSFDDQTVRSMEELKNLLKYYEAGQTVPVKVMRRNDGGFAEKTMELTLSKREDTELEDQDDEEDEDQDTPDQKDKKNKKDKKDKSGKDADDEENDGEEDENRDGMRSFFGWPGDDMEDWEERIGEFFGNGR